MNTPTTDALNQLRGKVVVLDIVSPYVILGTLTGCDTQYLFLEEADVHDLRQSNSTRDYYLVEAKQNGYAVNRKKVLVRREEIVGISALDDVVE